MKNPNLREQFESKLPKRAVESLKTNKEEYYRLYSKWLETINSEMIDALVFTLNELPEFVLNSEKDVVTKIKQALKKAGCVE